MQKKAFILIRIKSMNASHKLLAFVNKRPDEGVEILWCLGSRDKTDWYNVRYVSAFELINIEVQSYNRGTGSQAATSTLLDLEAIMHDPKCDILWITEEMMATWDPSKTSLIVSESCLYFAQ